MKKYQFISIVAMLCLGQICSAALVAEWNFNDSGNLGNDSAGSFDLTANTAVGTAPDYAAAGVVGGAAYFDGTDSYITPADIYPNGSFTFAAFVKADDTTVNEVTSPSSGRGGFQIYAANGNWRYRVNKQDNTFDYRIGSVVTTDWVHLAITFTKASGPDASGNYKGYFRVYENGAYVTGLAVSEYSAPDTYTMSLGNKSALGLFRGLMDEVQLYDTALNADQIAAIAAVPEPASLSLLGAGFVALFLVRLRLRK